MESGTGPRELFWYLGPVPDTNRDCELLSLKVREGEIRWIYLIFVQFQDPGNFRHPDPTTLIKDV